MAPFGDYHGYLYIFANVLQILELLIKPVTKQACKRLYVDSIIKLLTTPYSFCCGIYKGYNRRKSGLIPK